MEGYSFVLFDCWTSFLLAFTLTTAILDAVLLFDKARNLLQCKTAAVSFGMCIAVLEVFEKVTEVGKPVELY